MAASRKWLFKNKFRARVYGWRGSKLAISRLKEAASEIRSVAKSDPATAGEGTVSLMERIWPAFQDIDTSSGALGTAVARTLSELIPILADAPTDHATRSKWLERLFEAVQNDGVEYLGPVEERWGEIAHYPDLINEYADRLIEMVRRAWSDHQSFQHVTGTSICLSCMLEAGRYDELQELLATRRTKFWSWHRFGAEALVRQGLWEAAIAAAPACASRPPECVTPGSGRCRREPIAEPRRRRRRHAHDRRSTPRPSPQGRPAHSRRRCAADRRRRSAPCAPHPDHRTRLAEVRLPMAGWMDQRHEHLPPPAVMFAHIVLWRGTRCRHRRRGSPPASGPTF